MSKESFLEKFKRYFEKPEINAVTGLRLMMGWVFFSSGLGKLVENGLQYSYASTFLTEAVPLQTPGITFSFPEIIRVPGLLLVKAGTFLVEPLMQIFASVPFIGTLVVLTELFIGVSLLFGVFTRLGSLTGAFMMVLFYYGNAEWSHGLLNSDAVYFFVLMSLIAMKAGSKTSLDSYITERYEVKNKVLKKLLEA